MGLLLFILSIPLGIILLPVGIAYGLFKCFYHYHFNTGLNNADSKFLALAKAVDKYGGVACQELFNDTLITKDSQYPFGDIKQTISQVIGYNLKNNTLTKRGIKVNKILDKVFGEGHSLKAINE